MSVTNKKEYMNAHARKFYEKNKDKILAYKIERYKQKTAKFQPIKNLYLSGYKKLEGKGIIKEKATNNKLFICIVDDDGTTKVLPYMDFYNEKYLFKEGSLTLDYVEKPNDELMLLVSKSHILQQNI